MNDSAKNSEKHIQTEDEIFSLDIGTRTVVGILGHTDDGTFIVDDAVSVPHRSRAMTDGQIEDINEVARIAGKVKTQIENRNDIILQNVCIAAAGRALKTVHNKTDTDITDKGHISEDLLKTIEMEAISAAQLKLDEENPERTTEFYCVGHTVIRYYLDDYPIKSLLGHKGKKASAELIAAFLPDSVVESLYSVMDINGLSVRSLTLEPIAAMNVIIPPEVRLINIALVDIGAGTSDIAISKDGSIVAYAMATIAGDEITEEIIRKYLVDFNTAEEMKLCCGSDKIKYTNILGLEMETSSEEFLETLFPAVDNLADTIAKNILDANGGEPPAAVFLVGGGSQLHGLAGYVSDKLGLPPERTTVGGKKFMRNILIENVAANGPEFVTPVGIGVTATLSHGYDFSMITLNDRQIRIFDTKKITVADLLRLAGFKPSQIVGRSGRSLTYLLNGERQMIRGTLAEPAQITINGVIAAIDAPVKQGDVVTFVEASNGVNAEKHISDIVGDTVEYKLTVDDMAYSFGTVVRANGKQVSADYSIQNYDEITVSTIETLGDLMLSLNIDYSVLSFIKNGKNLRFDYLLQSGDVIVTSDKKPVSAPTEMTLAQKIAEINKAPEQPQTSAEPEANGESAPAEAENNAAGAPITISLNGRSVLLPQRNSAHEFLELMAIADVDMKNPPAGKDMITTINGKKASFMDVLKEGDVCIVRWED